MNSTRECMSFPTRKQSCTGFHNRFAKVFGTLIPATEFFVGDTSRLLVAQLIHNHGNKRSYQYYGFYSSSAFVDYFDCIEFREKTFCSINFGEQRCLYLDIDCKLKRDEVQLSSLNLETLFRNYCDELKRFIRGYTGASTSNGWQSTFWVWNASRHTSDGRIKLSAHIVNPNVNFSQLSSIRAFVRKWNDSKPTTLFENKMDNFAYQSLRRSCDDGVYLSMQYFRLPFNHCGAKSSVLKPIITPQNNDLQSQLAVNFLDRSVATVTRCPLFMSD